MIHTDYESRNHGLEVDLRMVSCLGSTPVGALLRESLEAQGIKLPAFKEGVAVPVERLEVVAVNEPESDLRRPNSPFDLLLEAASL